MIPELSRLSADRESEVAVSVFQALSYIGSNGISVILAAARDPSHPNCGAAMLVLGKSKMLGPCTDAVRTTLLAQLEDPAVNAWAAIALAELRTRPDLVVAALTRYLENTNSHAKIRAMAANYLIRFGEEAAPALPYLTNALNDPEPAVRVFATRAINEIQAQMHRK